MKTFLGEAVGLCSYIYLQHFRLFRCNECEYHMIHEKVRISRNPKSEMESNQKAHFIERTQSPLMHVYVCVSV